MLVHDRRVEHAVDGPRDLNAEAGLAPNVIGQGRQKMLVDPLTHEFIARTEAENPLGEAVELDPREPLIKAPR